ncbi:hypothetical protein [Streptomyces brasiliscabiei]|uniref:Uncharacterized protein n=1 Tax=Streptomyces brasiliscabiei TaxID=2736302 RepID=A0ABU8GN91_9ACTN
MTGRPSWQTWTIVALERTPTLRPISSHATEERVRPTLMRMSGPTAAVADFPGLYLRGLFTGGRHRAHITPGPVGELPVVDLPTVL